MPFSHKYLLCLFFSHYTFKIVFWILHEHKWFSATTKLSTVVKIKNSYVKHSWAEVKTTKHNMQIQAFRQNLDLWDPLKMVFSPWMQKIEVTTKWSQGQGKPD